MNKASNEPQGFDTLTMFYGTNQAIYGVYWFGGMGFWEVWNRTEPRLMGVYHKTTIDKSGKKWPEFLPNLISIWEGKKLYKVGGPGWEKPTWRQRKKYPEVNNTGSQIGINFN
jgi:hypothetical protein